MRLGDVLFVEFMKGPPRTWRVHLSQAGLTTLLPPGGPNRDAHVLFVSAYVCPAASQRT